MGGSDGCRLPTVRNYRFLEGNESPYAGRLSTTQWMGLRPVLSALRDNNVSFEEMATWVKKHVDISVNGRQIEAKVVSKWGLTLSRKSPWYNNPKESPERTTELLLGSAQDHQDFVWAVLKCTESLDIAHDEPKILSAHFLRSFACEDAAVQLCSQVIREYIPQPHKHDRMEHPCALREVMSHSRQRTYIEELTYNFTGGLLRHQGRCSDQYEDTEEMMTNINEAYQSLIGSQVECNEAETSWCREKKAFLQKPKAFDSLVSLTSCCVHASLIPRSSVSGILDLNGWRFCCAALRAIQRHQHHFTDYIAGRDSCNVKCPSAYFEGIVTSILWRAYLESGSYCEFTHETFWEISKTIITNSCKGCLDSIAVTIFQCFEELLLNDYDSLAGQIQSLSTEKVGDHCQASQTRHTHTIAKSFICFIGNIDLSIQVMTETYVKPLFDMLLSSHGAYSRYRFRRHWSASDWKCFTRVFQSTLPKEKPFSFSDTISAPIGFCDQHDFGRYEIEVIGRDSILLGGANRSNTRASRLHPVTEQNETLLVDLAQPLLPTLPVFGTFMDVEPNSGAEARHHEPLHRIEIDWSDLNRTSFGKPSSHISSHESWKLRKAFANPSNPSVIGTETTDDQICAGLTEGPSPDLEMDCRSAGSWGC